MKPQWTSVTTTSECESSKVRADGVTLSPIVTVQIGPPDAGTRFRAKFNSVATSWRRKYVSLRAACLPAEE